MDSELPTFEICPRCSQRTASQFFRTIQKTRVCIPCAQRAADLKATLDAQLKDYRENGGLGWLWKHIGYVAYATVGGVAFRFLVQRYLNHH
jgi:hypothetical protein